MKVLVVCSYNSGKMATFISEQVASLKNLGVEIDYYKIVGKGVRGYLGNLTHLKIKIRENNYDFIHAHYGLSGLLANLQWELPVITTYHGTDVNVKINQLLSLICSRLSKFNILTHPVQKSQLMLRKNYLIQPCGIDLDLFKPLTKSKCKKKLGFNENESLILFSSSFHRKEKNAKLAFKALSFLKDVKLIELKGYSRKEVVELINAVDAVLITSHYETGPLIVKEALACNTPVISTDVGDVKNLIEKLDYSFITKFNARDIAKKIEITINNKEKVKYRHSVLEYDNKNVANNIYQLYIKIAQHK